jgi:hypothetical protein
MKQKIFLFLLIFIFVFYAVPVVFAQTAADSEKQDSINKIQQQLAQLNQQLTQMLSQQQGTSLWCYAFSKNLGFANSGTGDVINLHIALQQQGISYAPDDINTYSTGTSRAIIQFQTKYGITPLSGYVGTKTRAKLNVLYGCTAAPTPSSNLNVAPPVQTTVPAINNPTPLSGTLDLSQNVSYSSQSVIAPQSKFKLADFSLVNNTTEAMNIKKIEFDLSTGSNLFVVNTYVSNLYVVYGTNQTSISNAVTNYNYWSVNFQLPAGKSIDLSLYGDVNSLIPLNSTVTSGLLVAGVSAVSGTAASTNSGAVLPGQNITFATGSLTVSQDSTTPASKMVAVNQKIVAGKFQFTSSSDSYNVSELKFIVSSSIDIPNLIDATLSDSASQSLLAQPVLPVYDGAYYVLDFNVNVPVLPNSSKSVTVSYDLSPTVDSEITNINIAPILVYVKAANSKGTLMDGAAGNYNNFVAYYNGISLPAAGVTVNGLYTAKSIPTLAASASSTSASSGSDVNLYTFSIAADPNGSISIKQITFLITINDPNFSNPYLNNFKFWKGNSDYTSSVAMGNVINNNYIGLVSTNGIGTGITNTVVVTFSEEEIIPAGKTQTYTLMAHVNNFTLSSASGSDSISTSVPSDAKLLSGGGYILPAVRNAYYGLSQDPNNLSPAVYNFLWSDMSELPTNVHNNFNGNYTNDWYNGFNILNLPLATQTINAQ